MVRRGGYRTQAQKDRRHSRRGGKTRTEQLREKIHSHRRYLRENNLKDPKFHAKPISKHVDTRGTNKNDYAVYGIYRDDDASHDEQWVLTGLAATDDYEKMAHNDRTRRSRKEIRGRYVLCPTHGTIRSEDGVEIKRFRTKAGAMEYVSAEGSERVEAGHYLIRPTHNPRSRREEVDADDFQDFRHDAYKVWE